MDDWEPVTGIMEDGAVWLWLPEEDACCQGQIVDGIVYSFGGEIEPGITRVCRIKEPDCQPSDTIH
jgi:hypothetical protein